jgi:hypothetical protein
MSPILLITRIVGVLMNIALAALLAEVLRDGVRHRLIALLSPSIAGPVASLCRGYRRGFVGHGDSPSLHDNRWLSLRFQPV